MQRREFIKLGAALGAVSALPLWSRSVFAAGEAVQVLFVIRIGQPNAFGFGDGERQLARVTPDIRFEFSLTGQKGFVVRVQ